LLSELRARAGLSLRELGRLCGLSEPYLSDLERGRRQPPPLKVVLILARALGADPYPLALRAARERKAVEIPLSDGVDPGAAVRLALRLLEEADHGCADPDR